jgi:hypothetical protein
VLHVPSPAHHLLLLNIILTMFCKEYSSWRSSLCNCLQSSITSPNLGTLFSITLSLSSSLNVRNQVLDPYKTTRKIVVRYVLGPKIT